MTTLHATHAGKTLAVQVPEGATLMDALTPTALSVRTGCNRNGSCGLCRVRIRSGRVSPPTAEEQLQLGPGLLAAGVRLACQARALDDVALEVEHVAHRPGWSPIPPEGLSGPAQHDATPGSTALRVALDVGTTNLNLTLWQADGAQRLAALRGPNPQAAFGSDIIARLQAAEDPVVARQLAAAVATVVMQALQTLLAGTDPAQTPRRILAVGNTAMLALLRGSHGGLLAPEQWDGPALWSPGEGPHWEGFDLLGANLEPVPPLGGFVGSDLLAAVLASDLTGTAAPALLVDFGTNTEIALWDGTILWVTSAAGGPAFEASGLACGLAAEEGAINRVRPGHPLGFDVLGAGAPAGVCATGLVDWIACLVGNKSLLPRGRFANGGPEPSLGDLGSGPGSSPGSGPGRSIVLTKRDVDVFQRGKAAIGAGIRVLMAQAGVTAKDLGRVITTGLFGRGLDIANAQAIGLLPTVPLTRVEAHANLALAGCEQLLNAPRAWAALAALRDRSRMINLARSPHFEELFLQALYLEPMEAP